MDLLDGLHASYRPVLFDIDITQVPSTIRQSLELARTCFQDAQSLVELRAVYLPLLEKRPIVLARVDTIIGAATAGLAEVCAIVEKCRPEADRGRASFPRRSQWIFSDETDFGAHEAMITRHHATVLTELNFLRQLALLTPTTPVGDAKVEAGGEGRGTRLFDNVALFGDLLDRPSDGQPGTLSAHMTSLVTSRLSNDNLGVDKSIPSYAESIADGLPAFQARPRTPADIPTPFQGPKELNTTSNPLATSEPKLSEPREGSGDPVTSKSMVFDPETAELSATKDLDHDQSLGKDTNVESINEELLLDMHLDDVHQFGKCWTCTPMESFSTDMVPITISDIPVVIPVESRYPLRAPVPPPPDPHPKFIDPTRQVTDSLISEVFGVYEDALGLYLLINGQLQIIVSDDFDYDYALSHRPRQFGGLEVSYIMESMTPTAGLASQVSAQEPQISMDASTATQSAPGVSSTAVQPPVAHIDAMSRMTIGSTIQVSVKGSKLKDRFEGRVGLMTKMGDRSFLTMPTHVVTSALMAAKSPSFPGGSWISDVQIVFSNGNRELGPISETFDPAAGKFPIGFIHDVSLVDVSNAPADLVSNIRTPIPTEWLSNSEWQEIKYRTTRLYLLKDTSTTPSRQANVKSIGLLDCQCQAVGQGIFRMRQPPRTSRFSLRRPSTGTDPRQDPDVWTGLVARSLLFRIHPDFRPDGVQSGTALCTMEELENGARCAKVAGFTAFAQDVSIVQNFDLEGPRLYSRLEQGRVAFYGAFQVPEALRENHHIM